ncbi:hypothetical protein VPH35_125795 [Triticum aestivum]
MTDDSVHPRCLQLMDTEGTGASTFHFHGGVDGLACITFGDSSIVNHTQVVDLANRATLPNLPKLPVAQVQYTSCIYATRCFGFGRTAKSGMYKLICLNRNTQRTCDVLTLEDAAQWRQAQPPPRIPSSRYDCMSGVAVNGALHFLSHDNYVLCFDLESEEWKVIPGPQGAARGQDTIGIAELNGTLCMCQTVPHVINIWLLSDSVKNIWIKAYMMPMDCPAGNFLLLYNYGFNSKPKLQLYDPRSGRWKDVKTPTNLIGKISICSLNWDFRFCVQL